MKRASKVHPNLQSAKIPETKWSLYILNMSREYKSGNPNLQPKILVSCLGKQPDSETWVLSKDVQIDSKGHLIPKENQKYFW